MKRYGTTERKHNIKFKILAFILLFSLILPIHGFVYANQHPPQFWHTLPGQPPVHQSPDLYRADEPEPSFVWNQEMILERRFETRVEGLGIRGSLPEIAGSYPPSQVLNELISEIERSLISNARRLRARDIAFSYTVRPMGELVSIIIYADVESAINRAFVQSVNFNHRTGRVMSLNDAMGMDIRPLLDRILTDMIRRNPERYYAALRGPMVPQAFYKNAANLVLLFDEFQLSSFAGGISRIELRRDRIRTFPIAPHLYRTDLSSGDNVYNVKMMPLRLILGELGYDPPRMIFEPVQVIQVFRNGQLRVEMWLGENNYQVHGVGAQMRSLEAAPQLENGVVYVPITFFDQILSMTTYSIDALGNVTFIAYIA